MYRDYQHAARLQERHDRACDAETAAQFAAYLALPRAERDARAVVLNANRAAEIRADRMAKQACRSVANFAWKVMR